MFQKFIINRDGVLKFGRVYLHRDMLSPGEQVNKKLYKTLRNEENYFYYFRLHQYLPCLCSEL
jgi:hypothetical protein